MDGQLKLLIIGAHPDDCEYHAGGLATIYRRLGHAVKFVSVTNGESGHYQISGAKLAARRKQEALSAAAVIGATAETWDHRDGYLQPTLDLRWQIIRELRTYKPDLVLTHRTNDYHPDHRAVGDAVRDASYLVTVPTLVADVPILAKDPVVAFMPDRFTKPYPLQADVVIDVGGELETIVDMICCHESQFFEWLPYNQGILDHVPSDRAGRRAWLREWYLVRLRPQSDRYRQELIDIFGSQRGEAIELAEVYEISEYASPLDAAARQRLFGFVNV